MFLLKRKKNADTPSQWPISLEIGENGSVSDCPRILDAISEKLDGYGFMVHVGQHDYLMVDVMEEGYLNHDGPDDEECMKEIPEAENMVALSKKYYSKKMLEIFNYLSERMHDAASCGDRQIIINAKGPPINGSAQMVKKVLTKLSTMGYTFETGISEDVKDYHKKVKTITVYW
jgi:hypothetical protein